MKKYDITTLYEMVKDRYENEKIKRVLNGDWDIIDGNAWDFLSDTLDWVKYNNETDAVTIDETLEELEDSERIWEEAYNKAPFMNYDIMEQVKSYISELEEVIDECGLINDDFYQTAQDAICRGIEREIWDGVNVFKDILMNIKKKEETAESLTA